MPSNPIAVKLRLSPSQAQVIAQGLEFLTTFWRLRQKGYEPDTTNPFFLKSLAPEKTGIFSQAVMDRVVAPRDRLKPKAKAGGRTQLDWLEVRILILACRVALDAARRPLSPGQKCVSKDRDRRSKNHPEVAEFSRKVARTIHSRERHEKVSTRVFRGTVDEIEFSARQEISHYKHPCPHRSRRKNENVKLADVIPDDDDYAAPADDNTGHGADDASRRVWSFGHSH